MVDVLQCPDCGGRMKVLAAVMNAEGAARLLRHAGLPTEAPAFSPARAPPDVEPALDDGPPFESDPLSPDDFSA